MPNKAFNPIARKARSGLTAALGIRTMRADNNSYVDFVMDQLASLRGVASGPFFGGVGLTPPVLSLR
jgi:hypothetical protein